jgi:predicted transcriptional regulator
MARTTVKATYSLAPDIVRRLEHLAERWNVSKSAALARAIAAADDQSTPSHPLDALAALQRTAQLDAAHADQWTNDLRAERRASSKRLP